ncbi:MAG: tetratricopeptide repeat protein, partial [Candidatus Altiarchaeum hamiconexum]|nr:tetratricopeptide repeat protein [Candidatus Altarchaeum hamiconexum]
IKINPNYSEAHNNLGNLLQNLKRYEEAEKEYREAIRINPDYADAHNNLGNLLQNLKRYEEAEKEYREAIKINPNDILAHQNISELYFVIKDYKKSLEYAEKSLEISKEIKYKIISKFLILINLIALERKCEKEKKEFLNFIRENKGYQLTWKFETIKERIKEMKFEREILELTEEIEKFRVRK